ncbi:glycosyltransferase family 4 protein [Maribacter hydrothermalis]|uniref:Glycosyl transferase family 1 n=1 Tax=Maribacter hydrothermalis TaxID=1836467 RepID=A0A1B7ZCN1_9FLAO|nr:glycosyltransferase family 4 protein [Maribacter hydrothermalis]APQ18574.1 glycosyl transferase family 1 [Maribacter hydrothermalis]OBR40870.1 glycosyl transferase family 1 [Maribacter hydrothermalis]
MRKVLVITYYWPPAGGPGVQRWLKFIKYLRDFGVEPVLYIPENPHYPLIDKSFLKDIPKNLTVYKHPIMEPYRLASIFSSKKTKRISSGIIQTKNQSFLEKALLWVRGNLFIPDARKFWVKPSVDFLKSVIEKEQIETIITTGPPHSVHLIGYYLKKEKQLNWIADFRDPWTTIGYHNKLKLTSSSAQKHKRLESDVLNTADKIIVTSKTTKLEFEHITKRPIRVITNGYDGEIVSNNKLDAKFTISHIGSLLSGRNPKNLWKVLADLVKENSEFKKALCLQFIGVVSDNVLQTIEDAKLLEHTIVLGYVSHEEALAYQRSSQILLLVEIDSVETKGIIPGKVFEYMAANRPILGVGPHSWEVGEIVKETKTGCIFNHLDDIELKNVLLNWFSQYQKGELSVSSTTIEHYSRRELTRKLAKYI